MGAPPGALNPKPPMPAGGKQVRRSHEGSCWASKIPEREGTFTWSEGLAFRITPLESPTYYKHYMGTLPRDEGNPAESNRQEHGNFNGSRGFKGASRDSCQ